MTAKRDRLELLLTLIDEAYEQQSWHGPNLRGSLRGVSEEEASWRPGKHRHNIWEIAVHATYWKYAVRRRLLGEKRGSFPLKGSNWFVRPDTHGGRTWEDDLALLGQEHRAMRRAIAGLPDADLEKKTARSKITTSRLVRGIAAHDLYHAGQIQLLKKLKSHR
jgi:hypothetical protein